MTTASARIRQGLRAYLRRFGGRKTIGADLKAGLVLGVESVPDGLAAGLLAGVSPLNGLYAYMFGALGGALATGSVFMTVQATGAMAVVISDVSAATPGGLTPGALTTLGLMTGLVMLGLASLGLVLWCASSRRLCWSASSTPSP
ncbi:SulP family inorganic anion transporter [Microbacterium sp. Mu-80]|uniref:SulP family inorganic anion transporter n=1 Tax=Microbacterium bandirmense TaxID=3122050 RepID=A0ABU8LDG1_9MICO